MTNSNYFIPNFFVPSFSISYQRPFRLRRTLVLLIAIHQAPFSFSFPNGEGAVLYY